MRAVGAGRVHPPLCRSGPQVTPGVHRPRDPAHQSRQRAAADGHPGARRGRRLPLPRPSGSSCRGRRRGDPGRGGRTPPRRRRDQARRSRHRHRAPTRPSPCRPTPGQDDPAGRAGGLRRRCRHHRCCPGDPRPSRTPRGPGVSCRCGTRAIHRPDVGHSHPAESVGSPRTVSGFPVVHPLPRSMPRGIHPLPAGARVAGPGRPAPVRTPAQGQCSHLVARWGCHSPVGPLRAPVPHRHARTRGGHARHASAALSRSPRHAIRALARLSADAREARMGRRRRARRHGTALGTRGRAHRPGLDRAPRRLARPALALGASLVIAPGARRVRRARHDARAAHRDGATHPLRPHRRRGVTSTLHPARTRARRVDTSSRGARRRGRCPGGHA